MTLSRIGLIERGLGAKPVSSMQGHAVHAADQQKLACAATAVIRSSDERTCCDDAFDEELEDARWFSRAEIAAGTPLLPFPQSIAFRLIEEWYNAGSARPLAEEAGLRGRG